MPRVHAQQPTAPDSSSLSCHRALATLAAVACARLHDHAEPSSSGGRERADYCSAASASSCLVAGNSPKWPTHALLGSQLTRRLDVIKQAAEQGCGYAHVPLKGPADWAEKLFDLGRSCAPAPSAFDPAAWHPIERSGKFLRSRLSHGSSTRTSNGKRSSSAAAAAAVIGLRSRLQPARTPWFESSHASTLQVVLHIRRGDLARHRLESDQGRWVPDEYYEEVLPRLVRVMAASGAASVAVHICSEYAPGWHELSRQWEALLLAAGAQTVAFHLGSPWPASWNGSEETNRDIMETLHHMSDADVLLTSRSGFSKAAAHYSLGLVISLSGAQPGACAGRASSGGASSSSPPCLAHGLPPPPRCTASTDARLNLILHEPGHVDFQCCFGRWRNATAKAKHCIGGCLAIGDDIRARPPASSRRRHAVGQQPDTMMPMWAPAHQSWVWCPARSRTELLRQLRSAASRTQWEAAVRNATAALVAQRTALQSERRGGNGRWKSLWQLLSRSHSASSSGADQLGKCCE
jgi:hypothetical protein